MNKVLVTGSSGFIGTHLVRALRERGDHVLEWDCKHTDTTGPSYNPAYDLHLLGPPMMDHLSWTTRAVDQVYHLAGNAHPGAYDISPSLMAREWIMAGAVIDACKYSGRPLVVASSAYAMGANTNYGRTKKGIEQMCELAGQQGSPVSVARIFNIYGPGQEKAITYTSTVVLNLYRSFKKGEWSLKNPLASRDFVYIDDAIHYLLRLASLSRLTGISATHEVASGRLTTITELGHIMARLMGHMEALGVPEKAVHQTPPYYLPGSPAVPGTVSLEEGLRRTIAHLEETA
jgi:UDP-glucose 4-epimerase